MKIGRRLNTALRSVFEFVEYIESNDNDDISIEEKEQLNRIAKKVFMYTQKISDILKELRDLWKISY